MARVRRSTDPVSASAHPRVRDEMAHLSAKRDLLVGRLENGSRQIEELRSAGTDVDAWEEYWIRLLRQYEQVCDELERVRHRVELPRAG